MARTREFDEEKVLESAMELFWEKGYEATSLSDLTSRMGIQRPSIYSAFGDKKNYSKLRYVNTRCPMLPVSEPNFKAIHPRKKPFVVF